MMLTGSSSSPFTTIESVLYKTLFTGHLPYAALTGEVKKASIDNGEMKSTTSQVATKESRENGSSGQHSPVSPIKRQSGALEVKEESENAETTASKKTN